MTELEEEKSNKRVAALTTVGVNAFLILALLFTIAWRAPDPPNPEFGIEINFGTDSQGSGSIQPKDPVGSQDSKQDDEPSQNDEQQTESQPVTESKPTEARPVESQPEEQQLTTKAESPVTVKEEKKKEETKPIEKPVEKKQETKAETQPERKVDQNAVFPSSSKSSGSGQGKQGKEGSQGDDTGKTGDKGDPNGKLDANAMYGKAGGGGGGFGLQMSGWGWDQTPKPPSIPDNMSGRIVFEIEVDEDGEIVQIKTLEKTLSADAERLCRQEIEKRSLVRNSAGAAPERSKGIVVFNLTVK